ncbi:MAG: hypothetical protein WC748_03020 [Legionellales bacterium]|jgi:hypothetical protein
MQLTAQAIAIIVQLKDKINNLKSDEGIKKFILPSIDIFNTSICERARDTIKSTIVTLGVTDGDYAQVIESYQRMQVQYLLECFDSVSNLLQTLIDNKAAVIYINKLMDFIEFEQVSTIAPDISAGIFEKMNVAIKYRVLYYLTEEVYAILCQFREGAYINCNHISDQLCIKKIDKFTVQAVQNQDKILQVSLLYYSELHIREASIVAMGELIRNDQLSDIFTVYKTAAYGLSGLREHNHVISYYSLAVKTLMHLSKASNFMQPRSIEQQLSVHIQPMNQETAIGHYGLVRRSIFGVVVTYQDTQGLILDVNSSPGFNHVYQVEPAYKLDPDLKMHYLQHIRLLTAQLNDAPEHTHKKRREEKLNALEYIVRADNQGELTPATFDQAKAGKLYLYAATWSESITEQLITNAELDVRAKMWRKFSKDKHSIGQLGYSITDNNLLAKLLNKYLSFTQGISYDADKRIQDLLENDPERINKTGVDLWRHDKKRALEIILIAHFQQLLHPALLRSIEERYPMMYARTFWVASQSEVENLVRQVKDNLLSLLWLDAANEVTYLPHHYNGIN